MTKARKIKIIVQTEKFNMPIPAFSFSVIRFFAKMAKKAAMSRLNNDIDENERKQLEMISTVDFDAVFDVFQQEEPFEIVTVEDHSDGKAVYVRIYTL